MKWPLLWLFSPKYFIGVNALIINEQGEIWLQQHRYWPEQAWGLPGGIVGRDERLEDALQREIKEEIGRSAVIMRPLVCQKFYRQGQTICFLAHLGDEPLHLDDREIIDAGYFHPRNLPGPMSDGHRKMIGDALQEYEHPGGLHEHKN